MGGRVVRNKGLIFIVLGESIGCLEVVILFLAEVY